MSDDEEVRQFERALIASLDEHSPPSGHYNRTRSLIVISSSGLAEVLFKAGWTIPFNMAVEERVARELGHVDAATVARNYRRQFESED
jgi:hypothetical protein